MRTRFEPNGVHLYDRTSGLHALFDEFSIASDRTHKGPRVISLAITNRCNLECPFCYVPKDDKELESEYIIDICNAMDTLGVLEVAFGGGEPTLHRELVNMCEIIWNSTELGISLTTNGHLLTSSLISSLEDNISIIRISVDSIDPLYNQIRRLPIANIINNIQLLHNRISFGINMVVNNKTIHHLDNILTFSASVGAINLLLLPEVHGLNFTLDDDDWKVLEKWINDNWQSFPIEITTAARDYLDCPFLFNLSGPQNQNYMHIGADKRIRGSSYHRGGELILNGDELIRYFEQSGPDHSGQDL